MTNIIPTDQQLPSTPVTNLNRQLMQDSDRLEQVVQNGRVAINQPYHSKHDKLTAITAAVKAHDDFVHDELPDIETNLDRALNQPATLEHISVKVALLLKSFPNSRADFDATIYSRQLMDYLEDWKVGEGVLEVAFRYLLLNHKWLPSISEVWDAVLKAKNALLLVANEVIPRLRTEKSILNYYLEDARKEVARRF
jgi:hypothetical protein